MIPLIRALMRGAITAALSLALLGCKFNGVLERQGYEYIARLSAGERWAVSQHEGATPSIAAYKPADNSKPTWVYIEGDGSAWVTRFLPASDPTPEDPVALKLAMRPHDEAVLYLGRPCQYKKFLKSACASSTWLGARYSSDIVEHLNTVIDATLPPDHSAIVLVGYSGGGAIAALLASRRSDVRALITLAGNLDTEAWTKLHSVTPLAGSLNPRDVATKLGKIQHIHLFGGIDRIVPGSILESFVAALPPATQVQIVDKPTYDHRCCWSQDWTELRNQLQALLVNPRSTEVSRVPSPLSSGGTK